MPTWMISCMYSSWRHADGLGFFAPPSSGEAYRFLQEAGDCAQERLAVAGSQWARTSTRTVTCVQLPPRAAARRWTARTLTRSRPAISPRRKTRRLQRTAKHHTGRTPTTPPPPAPLSPAAAVPDSAAVYHRWDAQTWCRRRGKLKTTSTGENVEAMTHGELALRGGCDNGLRSCGRRRGALGSRRHNREPDKGRNLPCPPQGDPIVRSNLAKWRTTLHPQHHGRVVAAALAIMLRQESAVNQRAAARAVQRRQNTSLTVLKTPTMDALSLLRLTTTRSPSEKTASDSGNAKCRSSSAAAGICARGVRTSAADVWRRACRGAPRVKRTPARGARRVSRQHARWRAPPHARGMQHARTQARARRDRPARARTRECTRATHLRPGWRDPPGAPARTRACTPPPPRSARPPTGAARR